MATSYTLNLETTPTPQDIAVIRDGLSAYNHPHIGDDSFDPLTLLLRDGARSVCGGLLGGTYRGWLVIDILWIIDTARRHGWGSQLLHRAEQIAITRGCYAAHLDTMSFQAPGFYEQHGYTIFGVLDDPGSGYQRYYFRKDLLPAPGMPAT